MIYLYNNNRVGLSTQIGSFIYSQPCASAYPIFLLRAGEGGNCV